MPRTPKRPDVSKIPVLYAAWAPAPAMFLWCWRPIGESFPVAMENPTMLHSELAQAQIEQDDHDDYWIVKYIPVAILDTEYRQQRIPIATEGSTD